MLQHVAAGAGAEAGAAVADVESGVSSVSLPTTLGVPASTPSGLVFNFAPSFVDVHYI